MRPKGAYFAQLERILRMATILGLFKSANSLHLRLHDLSNARNHSTVDFRGFMA
jgi:hypothetical protein